MSYISDVLRKHIQDARAEGSLHESEITAASQTAGALQNGTALMEDSGRFWGRLKFFCKITESPISISHSKIRTEEPREEKYSRITCHDRFIKSVIMIDRRLQVRVLEAILKL